MIENVDIEYDTLNQYFLPMYFIFVKIMYKLLRDVFNVVGITSL